MLGLGLSQSLTNAKPRNYTTTFQKGESPIQEGQNWINGRHDGLDWADVATKVRSAYGTESGSIKYDDSTALLTGEWNPDQTVEATVFTKNQSDAIFEEVEVRLRSSISAHRNTGYEINFRCLKTVGAYTQIVRWNGKLGDFTYIDARGGAEFGVKDGDIVKGTIKGNVITAYINGRQVLQAADSTYKTGNPGMGFYLEGPPNRNTEFGFIKFSARDGS